MLLFSFLGKANVATYVVKEYMSLK